MSSCAMLCSAARLLIATVSGSTLQAGGAASNLLSCRCEGNTGLLFEQMHNSRGAAHHGCGLNRQHHRCLSPGRRGISLCQAMFGAGALPLLLAGQHLSQLGCQPGFVCEGLCCDRLCSSDALLVLGFVCEGLCCDRLCSSDALLVLGQRLREVAILRSSQSLQHARSTRHASCACLCSSSSSRPAA